MIRTKKDLRDEVAQFNKDCPVGTSVVVTKDDGEQIDSVVTHEAWLMGGHTPVVMVKGIAGCYLLTRVRRRS